MGFVNQLKKIYCRLQYPVSLPEDVAGALGIQVDNYLSFDAFIAILQSAECRPTRLMKYMPRQEAEQAFHMALRKETFKETALFSYYFSRGWLGFRLHFDDQSRLRRLYLQHKELNQGEGIEIALCHYEVPLPETLITTKPHLG
jgi:hypothetical protein